MFTDCGVWRGVREFRDTNSANRANARMEEVKGDKCLLTFPDSSFMLINVDSRSLTLHPNPPHQDKP